MSLSAASHSASSLPASSSSKLEGNFTTTSTTTAAPATSFPLPNPTASLLLSHRPAAGKKVLILGTGKLAASRCFACLEAGILPVVFGISAETSNDHRDLSSSRLTSQSSIGEADDCCPELQHRISNGSVQYYRIPSSQFSTKYDAKQTWDSVLDEFDADENLIFAACITDTLHSGDDIAGTSDSNQKADEKLSPSTRAKLIAQLCRRRRIPINVADKPELCDFSFPASYRFPCITSNSALPSIDDAESSPPSSSSLQIAVTTNGRGCRLAGRIRREIVSALPRNVGDAVEKVGFMRDLAKRTIDNHPDPRSSNRKISASRSTHGAVNRTGEHVDIEEEDLSFDTTPLNSPVPQLTPKNPIDTLAARKKIRQDLEKERQRLKEEEAEKTKRRMRWVAQISEYWPIEYLGDLKQQQMNDVLRAYGEDSQTNVSNKDGQPDQFSSTQLAEAAQSAQNDPSKTVVEADDSERRGRASTRDINPTSQMNGAGDSSTSATISSQQRARSQHSLDIRPPPRRPGKGRGHIYLLGSGPGHPGLLTTFAYHLLTSTSTDLILSDKLVPSTILRLIPSSTELEIAKKFPGNAEGAQSELIAKAMKAALEQGKNVVRLKQGDPFVYGRGGEEVLAFRKAGIECTVVPGISSAIAAPALLNIPVTQRGVADSFILCTGVGKGGQKVSLPAYDRSRTLVVLMGVARLKAVIETLTGRVGSQEGGCSRRDPGTVEGKDQEGSSCSCKGNESRFPVYLPIAIIERASSSDQRLVASTLENIVSAMESVGEQRPPGMMVIGWSVLSLFGSGDTSVQDDGIELADQPAQLEARDRKRIQTWLNSSNKDANKTFIVKEGLDTPYKDCLKLFSQESKNLLLHHHANHLDPTASFTLSQALPATNDDGARIAYIEPSSNHNVTARSETGWAPSRYQNGSVEGGWLPGEKPNIPATDLLNYQQNLAYAEIQARLKQQDLNQK